MKIQHSGLLTGLLLTLTGLAAAVELPERDEYAYGFELQTTGDSGFFSMIVPIEVYRSVSDPRLRDSGVYNAEGRPVPRIFEHPPEPDTGMEQRLSIGLIPLYGQQAEQAEKLRLLLHQDAHGTRLELNEPVPGAEEPQDGLNTGEDGDNTLTAYIADVHRLEHALETLVFHWPSQTQGFIGKLTVETSDDLERWRVLGTATLAELEYENSRIEHKILKLRTKPSDYLRITWRDMPPAWSLNSLTGIYTEAGAPSKRDWLTLDSVQHPGNSHEFFFELRGYPPVDRVNVLLPDENVVLRASIFHRRYGEENWRLSLNDIFYNIEREGDTLQTPIARLSETSASEWKIRIESGVTTGPVRLQLGWRPEQLVFLAQGPPPFELVTGRARDRLEDYPQERLLGDTSIFAMLRKSGQPGSATAGPRIDIGGAEQLEIAVTRRWRVLLLWAGLTGAIALVGWLVFSLMREMKQG